MEKHLLAMLRSWKTTAMGLIILLQAVLLATSHMIDSDPATNPDWNSVITAAMAFVALLMARDADVSSQDAGVRP